MYSDSQLTALRKKYNKTLWLHIGFSALTVAMTCLLVYSPLFTPELLIPWLIAAGVGLGLAIVEYAIERALYRKGKRAHRFLSVFFFAAILLLLVLWETGAFGGYALHLYPLLCGFMFNRPLIPAIGLLRDTRRVNDGDPCETVGRMKSGTYRADTAVGRDAYLLFEDELTHEVHLLRMGSVSPLHRYRVLYLPHSGLAMGEMIPDNITFDPFGNPMEREAEAVEINSEKPAYTESRYAEKPDYTEDEPAEKPWYQNPEAFSNDPPKAEPREAEGKPDPNSSERIKAAKFGMASKVCKIMMVACIAIMFLGVLALNGTAAPFATLFLFLPAIVSAILQGVFKDKELKLRCTKRTTGFCIDTVRRHRGKHTTRHPIVEYEVKGVNHTAELPLSCTRDAVGDTYTLYYDPLDPDTVRAERRGLFE